MIVVISPEQNYRSELCWVNKLLEAGLENFHVRKPSFSESQMSDYLSGIDLKFLPRVVLHQHHQLAKIFKINRLHISEDLRLEKGTANVLNDYRLSTSTHSIVVFNQLDNRWDYAFYSPVFSSLTKPGYRNGSVLEQLKCKSNKRLKLIGLGGITSINKLQVLENGADGVAFLGAIWLSENPLKSYNLCSK